MERRLEIEIKKVFCQMKRVFASCTNISKMNKMTGTHGFVVGYLLRHQDKDVFQRDLEKRFSVRRSTMSEILKLMESNGLIERIPVDYDARLKKIMLTQKALEEQKLIEKEFSFYEEEFVKGISDEEMNSFFSTLDKIMANAESIIEYKNLKSSSEE